MNREIKFRAWDKKEKEMCIVDRLTFMFESENGVMAEVVESKNTPPIDEFRRRIFPEDFDLMQYTGLLDKNGKEIYEGDIFATPKFKNPECSWSVIWNNKKCKFEVQVEVTKGRQNYLKEALYPSIQWEVIGNIYSNPELLKENK